MKKRILPALLALCMVLSLLPVTVLAAAGDGTCQCTVNHSAEDGSADNKGTATADHSGTCGAATTGYKKFCDNCVGTAQAQKYACSCDGSCQAAEGHVGEHSAAYTLDETGDCQACAAAKSPQGGGNQGGDTPEEPAKCETCGCPIGDGEGECTAQACAHDDVGDTRPSTCKLVLCNSVDCQKQGTVHLKTAHVIGTNCAEGASAAYNQSRKACTADTHQDGCPKQCPVTGCVLTAGHDSAHKNAQGSALNICTKDKWCPKGTTAQDKANHEPGCPVGDAIVVTTGGTTPGQDGKVTDAKVKVTFAKDMPVYVACQCAKNHANDGTHIDDVQNNVACPLHNGTTAETGVKVMVTVTTSVDIDIPAFDAPTKEEQGQTVPDTEKLAEMVAEKAAALKAEAEKKGAAAYGIDDEDWETALAAQQQNSAYVAQPTDICAECKAALGLTTCTKAADCNADKHDKDCLTLCTHSAACKNTKGSAAAHVVYYKVMANGENKGSYATYEEAVAARTDKSWSIVTDPCPMAQVDESVVVGADEEAPAEDPTKPEEPKAPEKAEDFDDLKGDEWYAEDLTNLMSKGIVKGSLDDGKYSFGATDKLTTSHLVVFLSRVLDKGLVTEGKDWDKAATAWATEDGLTEGVEVGEITRKDVVLVLWRAAGKPESTQSLEALTDVEGLTEDEAAALRWAVETKVITGYEDNTFKPGNSITRAEMVAVLSRFDGVVNAK